MLHHANEGKTGLTEFEVWGDTKLPLERAPHPTGNIAYNPGDKLFPKASASYSDSIRWQTAAGHRRQDELPAQPDQSLDELRVAQRNRLAGGGFRFGKEFTRIELAIYDDRGGVQPPSKYEVEYWDGKAWQVVRGVKKSA